MAIDPAVKKDAFGIACGYLGDNGLVVDGVRGIRKEEGDGYMSPTDIWEFIKDAIYRLNVYALVFDTWMYPELIERCEKNLGLNVVKHIVNAEDYDKWLEMQEGQGQVPLTVVYDDFLERETDNLLVESTPTGKKRVDHPKPNGCLVGDVKIKLANGDTLPIGNLDGKSCKPVSCMKSGKRVIGGGYGKMTKMTDTILDITLDNRKTFKCTPEHRIMLTNGKYKEARDLLVTDKIMSADYHPYHNIVRVEQIIYPSPIPVYDLSVPQYDNFALDCGIFVHNSKDLADSVCNVIWYLTNNEIDEHITPVGRGRVVI
jgi:hypothetical protein